MDARKRKLSKKIPQLKEKSVKKLFELECKHKKEFNKGEITWQELKEGKKDFKWQECEECVCAFIPVKIPHSFDGYIFRDVCFANWHGYIR